jgi:hypothetical protein
MYMSPQAVLFDYGDVLCLPQSLKEVEAMAAFLDSSLSSFEEAYWKDCLGFDPAAHEHAVRPAH